MKPRTENWIGDEKLTHGIIAAFYYVYNRLGPGFLERIYMNALERVLIRRGFKVAREVLVPVHLDYEIIGYERMDMLVEDRVVVEGKRLGEFRERDMTQLFGNLKATIYEIGLLLYFDQRPKFFRVVCSNSRKTLANPHNAVVPAESASLKPSICTGLTEPDASTHRSSDQPPTSP